MGAGRPSEISVTFTSGHGVVSYKKLILKASIFQELNSYIKVSPITS